MSRGLKLSLVVALVWVLSGATAAEAAPGELAAPNAGAAGIEWRSGVAEIGLELTVSGPQGFYLRQEFAPGQAATFSVFDEDGQLRPAGSYSYELRAVPQIDGATRAQLEAARETGSGTVAKAGRLTEAQAGSFAIRNGAIVMGGEEEPGAGKPAGPRLAPKDQVIPDDLIVQGSTCVGIDCVNNEDFGFDTIRLKENNTRIQFNDTSTASGFPTNNWQIRANSSSSGGTSFLGFVDQGATGQSETGTILFAVEAGAAANSLFVDNTSRVGFRTSTPVLDIHINTSNTPGLRLEQNSSGGFTAQTWDVAGNEANFFVRSVTTGSQLPFRIRPGAPSSSIDIGANGDVGIGTGSPGEKLHVTGSDGSNKILVEETSGTAALRNLFTMRNNGGIQLLYDRTDGTSNDWQMSNFNATFELSVPGSTPAQFSLNANGNLTIGGTQYLTGSSRELKENFVPVNGREILGRVVAMPLTEWNAKADPTQRHIGPVAEDWFAAFGLGPDDKHLSPTDVGGVALAAIKGLYEELQARNGQIEELQRQVEELSALAAEVEQLRAQQ